MSWSEEKVKGSSTPILINWGNVERVSVYDDKTCLITFADASEQVEMTYEQARELLLGDESMKHESKTTKQGAKNERNNKRTDKKE